MAKFDGKISVFDNCFKLGLWGINRKVLTRRSQKSTLY